MTADIRQTAPWIGLVRRVSRRLVSPLLQLWFHRHYSQERGWRRHGIDIRVAPGVFPPGPTVSTTVLLDYLVQRFAAGQARGLNVLDMGCGTGLVGLSLARVGARVVATDINPVAIRNAQLNAARNGLDLTLVRMDQSTGFRPDAFDLVIITPPYYPRDATNMAEKAWYCGQDFRYFAVLTPQLSAMVQTGTEVLMVLSEDCDLQAIATILARQGLCLKVAHARRRFLELTLILRVVLLGEDQKFS